MAHVVIYAGMSSMRAKPPGASMAPARDLRTLSSAPDYRASAVPMCENVIYGEKVI